MVKKSFATPYKWLRNILNNIVKTPSISVTSYINNNS